jgi:hypothetical protein
MKIPFLHSHHKWILKVSRFFILEPCKISFATIAVIIVKLLKRKRVGWSEKEIVLILKNILSPLNFDFPHFFLHHIIDMTLRKK